MAAPDSDTNGVIAALLRDLAELQSSKQSEWGYKRAAAAIYSLDESIESMLGPDGSLPKIGAPTWWSPWSRWRHRREGTARGMRPGRLRVIGTLGT